ncbi:MAG TPA: YhjD/YihY/BrkB family envelope integrity protein, partial [Candidatus Acidoferrum sp.]|nr:YhjD/YihY/BrkB family envelope integrity protein [Candidatus Acidoferrum sp.]
MFERLLGHPRVATTRRVLDAYGMAGGGLLAAGLAYTGLFAVLSASLFAIGVTGFIVGDAGRQAAVVAELARRLPPLAELLKTGLDRVAGGAVQFSILGLIGLAWGTSRFYDNLDVAFSRVFNDEPARRFASRTMRGFGVVAILVGVIVATVVLASIATFVDSVLLPPDSAVVRLGSTIAFAATGLALYFASVAIVYRMVPPRPPTWRALLVP